MFPRPPAHACLQAELQGALPPPGAPPGARAPINPRASCPVYVADLTTEVLSAASQEVRLIDDAAVVCVSGGRWDLRMVDFWSSYRENDRVRLLQAASQPRGVRFDWSTVVVVVCFGRRWNPGVVDIAVPGTRSLRSVGYLGGQRVAGRYVCVLEGVGLRGRPRLDDSGPVRGQPPFKTWACVVKW